MSAYAIASLCLAVIGGPSAFIGYSVAGFYGFINAMALGLVCSVLAIVFSMWAFRDLSRSPMPRAGRGMAMAGLTFGVVGVVCFGTFWSDVVITFNKVSNVAHTILHPSLPPGHGNAWQTEEGLSPTWSGLRLGSSVHLASIAAGSTVDDLSYAVALDSSGRAWAWGVSSLGALGSPVSESEEPVAVDMPVGESFTAIATGGEHVLALDRTGHIWAWGRNSSGQLGNGTTATSYMPVEVKTPAGVTFTAVAAGNYDSLALDNLGRAWTWGLNSEGALGYAAPRTETNVSVPAMVSMPSGVSFTAIAAAGGSNLALDRTGRAWAWGSDGDDQLGIAASAAQQPCQSHPACQFFVGTPQEVIMPAGVKFTEIAAGNGHSLALDANGVAWAWGNNRYGELGVGTNAGPQTCLGIADPCAMTPVSVTMPQGIRFVALAASENHSLALDSNGQLWGWGDNGYFELGVRTHTCDAPPLEPFPCSTAPIQSGTPVGVTIYGNRRDIHADLRARRASIVLTRRCNSSPSTRPIIRDGVG